jgi:type III secretion protein Q
MRSLMTAPKHDDPNASALDSEPVTLSFQIGTLAVSAAELASLDAGYIFPLRVSKARPIVILANGARFGAGELVEIDGAIAVRLCEGEADGS